MASSRIHTILVATPLSEVIYERFYDSTNESERAEVRAAFRSCRDNAPKKLEDGQGYVGNYREAVVVLVKSGDICFYALGSGDYDELALEEVLETVILALKGSFGRPLTEPLLHENYATLCLTIDEVILEGIYCSNDKDAIRKGTKMKVHRVHRVRLGAGASPQVPWET